MIRRCAAFSLVELSIVLVILGLLTGGILAGQSLIRGAELRAVGTEYARWRTATQAFRDKYFGLPGDLTNATAFWGTMPGGCPNNARPVQTTTCNGNGNGRIEYAGYPSNEAYAYWQHLANAGLIEGSFSGTSNDAATFYADSISAADVNVPRSKLGNGVWLVSDQDVQPISSMNFFEGNYGNTFWFGGLNSGLITRYLLKPEEQWNIDTKLDDGKPGTGIIRTREDSACHDQTASSSAARAGIANYALSNNGLVCMLIATLNL